MATTITSVNNERVRDALRLEKRSVRDRQQQTLVEGVREVSRALAAGVVPVMAFVCHARIQGAEAEESVARLVALDRARRTHLLEVTPEVHARLAVREASGGIVLVIPYLARTLADLPISANPFLAVIEGVEKPGNLGAILRSADAAGVDGVIVSAGATDLHNPNVVRASLGTLFTVPVCEAEPAASIALIRQHGMRIICATPEASLVYTKADLRAGVAVVLGSEAFGLGEPWRATADAMVHIPMHGVADSLNLATATALLLYEVVRQRSA